MILPGPHEKWHTESVGGWRDGSELGWGAGDLDLDFGVTEDSGRQRSQGLVGV